MFIRDENREVGLTLQEKFVVVFPLAAHSTFVNFAY